MVNASFEIVAVIFIQEAKKTRESLFLKQEVIPQAIPHAITVESHIPPSIAKLFIGTI